MPVSGTITNWLTKNNVPDSSSRARNGVRPEIVYMAVPVTVDNVSHQILA